MNHDIDGGDNYYNGGDNYYNGGDNYYNGGDNYNGGDWQYKGSGEYSDELNDHFLEFAFFILGSTSIVVLLSKICPRENTSNVMDENLIEEEEAMPNLTTIEFNEVTEKECAVCLEEFKDTEKISKLDCDHSYHDDCIQEWFQKDRSCPLCRYQV